MSQTYIANIAQILSWSLTMLGVQVGVDPLVTTITTLLAIGTGAWVFVGRWRAGGVTPSGVRK
jgi:hypothetical protein